MAERRTAGFVPGLGLSLSGDSDEFTLSVLPEYLLAAGRGGERYLVRVVAPAYVASIGAVDSLGAEIEVVHWFDEAPDDAADRARLLEDAQGALRSFFTAPESFDKLRPS